MFFRSVPEILPSVIAPNSQARSVLTPQRVLNVCLACKSLFLTVFSKSYILDVWIGYEYISDFPKVYRTENSRNSFNFLFRHLTLSQFRSKAFVYYFVIMKWEHDAICRYLSKPAFLLNGKCYRLSSPNHRILKVLKPYTSEAHSKPCQTTMMKLFLPNS